MLMHDDDEDDGEQPEHQQQHDLADADITEQLRHLVPAQAAAAAAAAAAKRLVKQQADPDGEGAIHLLQLLLLRLLAKPLTPSTLYRVKGDDDSAALEGNMLSFSCNPIQGYVMSECMVQLR
jgi:hypothetical protein